MRSKDILKQALVKYDGTLIIVSHDREFLDGLVTKVYEFKNKGIKEYLGGIYDFLYRRNIENLKELERKDKTTNENNKKKEITDSKLTFLEKKEFEKKIRKVNNQISASEKKIEVLEIKIEEIQRKMESAENISFEPTNEIFVNYENIKKQLDEEIKNWEMLNIELEELKTEGK